MSDSWGRGIFSPEKRQLTQGRRWKSVSITGQAVTCKVTCPRSLENQWPLTLNLPGSKAHPFHHAALHSTLVETRVRLFEIHPHSHLVLYKLNKKRYWHWITQVAFTLNFQISGSIYKNSEFKKYINKRGRGQQAYPFSKTASLHLIRHQAIIFYLWASCTWLSIMGIQKAKVMSPVLKELVFQLSKCCTDLGLRFSVDKIGR